MSKKEQRQRHLVALLEQNSTMRVGALADALAVTPETVRRDLDEMAGRGLLARTYGGAVVARGLHEPSLSVRHNLLVKEREAIARAAVPFLVGARVLMIGSGATTLQVARRIAIEMNGVTVITHSFGIATVLSLNPTITVLMVPGVYHAGEGATYGAQALRFLDDLFADWTILGASGLTDSGANDALIESGEVYAAMVRASARTLLVADGSKFGRRFPSRFARWTDIERLVTDTRPKGRLLLSLERCATALTVAGP